MPVIIGRKRELEELGAVAALRASVNERGERIAEDPAPLVIVYGGASTGKSTCVALALQQHAELYAMIDCTAIYSAQELYREILVQLYKNLREGSVQLQLDAIVGGNGGQENDGLVIEGAQGAADTAHARTRAEHSRAAAAAGSGSDSDGSSSSSSDNSSHSSNGLHDSRRRGRSVQRAVARAKRVRAHQREQQMQREAEANSSRVNYEGYNSLNFLSFIKALGQFMAAAVASSNSDDDNVDSSTSAESLDARTVLPPRKRVVYLALDQADRLLDRGLAPLLTCIFTINDQLAYLNMFTDATWDVSVLLITRAMSLEFDRLVAAFFPAYIAFQPHTSEQVADILVEQLRMQPVARLFRRWLLHLSTLLPPTQGDWLEFRRHVVHLLPDFQAFFTVATADATTETTTSKASDKTLKKLTRTTNERVSAFEKTRRKHLFGHDKLGASSSSDPTDSVACTNLSRSCLLLVLAGYLASFNPQDADTHFLSSSGGARRKKRVRRTAGASQSLSSSTSNGNGAPISQLLIGPRIFTLQRLLAIYLNLRAEASADLTDQFATAEAREDIFTHLATLVRMQLFQRTSPPNTLDDIKFRCLADSRFVHETAKRLRFPLESYLNTTT